MVDTFGALKKKDLEINPQAEQDKDTQSVLLCCRERAFSTLGLLSLNVDVQEKRSKRQPIYEPSLHGAQQITRRYKIVKAHRLINRLIISLVVAGVLLVGLLWLLRAGVPGAREIAVELPDLSSPTRPLPAPSPRRSLGLLGYDDDVRVSDTTEPGPGNMCVGVMTGTHLVTLIIKNPNGLGTIHDYHAATFDQRVLSRSSTSAQVEIISRAYFDTTAGYPLDTAALPSEIQTYLLPNSYQQSDHPAIQAQALALVGEAQTEVQAVVAILDWVRANICLLYTSPSPRD